MKKGKQEEEEEEEEDGMKAVCGEQIAAACKGSLPCLRAATSNRQMGPAYIPLPPSNCQNATEYNECTNAYMLN